MLLPASGSAGKYNQTADPDQVNHLGECFTPVPVMFKALARYGNIKMSIRIWQLMPCADNVNALSFSQVATHILVSIYEEVAHAAVNVQ
jgi:hypothetical protein